MKWLATGLTSIAVFTNGALAAQTRSDSTPARPLSLGAAIAIARQNNPDLRIVRTLTDSALGELRIARAIPNPVVAGIPNVPYQYSATLPVDVGPQRWRRTAVARLAVNATRLDTQDSERLLATAVARLYFDILLADARREITTSRRDVVRQLVGADSARVRAGDLPERALFRSQVELVKAEADLSRSIVDAQAGRLALQGLMGVDRPDTALTLTGTLAYAEVPIDASDAALAVAIGQRPDVRAAQQREAQAGAVAGLASAAMIPIPQLSVVRQFNAPFESGRYTSLGIGLEVPLLNQYAGQRERAAAGRVAASTALRRTEAAARRDIITARAEFMAQRSLVKRYQAGVLSTLEQNVDATRYAYVRGAASLLEVLDALRARQDVLADYNAALHDYWVSVHALRAALGVRDDTT